MDGKPVVPVGPSGGQRTLADLVVEEIGPEGVINQRSGPAALGVDKERAAMEAAQAGASPQGVSLGGGFDVPPTGPSGKDYIPEAQPVGQPSPGPVVEGDFPPPGQAAQGAQPPHPTPVAPSAAPIICQLGVVIDSRLSILTDLTIAEALDIVLTVRSGVGWLQVPVDDITATPSLSTRLVNVLAISELRLGPAILQALKNHVTQAGG